MQSFLICSVYLNKEVAGSGKDEKQVALVRRKEDVELDGEDKT